MWFEQNGLRVRLPRALVGGLRRGPTEELLRWLAKDCAALDRENRELKDALARLGFAPAEVGHGSAAKPPPVERALAAAPVVRAGEADELVSVLLGVLQRVARELGSGSVEADSGTAVGRLRADVRELERDVVELRVSLREAIEELGVWRSGLEEWLERPGPVAGKRRKPSR